MNTDDEPTISRVSSERPRPRPLWRRVFLSALLMVLMWPIISLPAAVLVYLLIPPTYEAFAIVRGNRPLPFLFGQHPYQAGEREDVDQMLRTEVEAITGDHVLELVVASPLTRDLPMVKNATDPKAELRSRLSVKIPPETGLIRIAIESTDPEEAATLVNQVVESYMSTTIQHHTSKIAALKKQLNSLRQSLTTEIEDFCAGTAFQTLRSNAPAVNPSPTRPGTDQQKLTAHQKRDQLLEDVYLTHELTSLLDLRTSADKALRQLELESNLEHFPIELQEAAQIPKAPSGTARIQWTIYTVIAMFFVLLALFCIRWSMPRPLAGQQHKPIPPDLSPTSH